ANDISNATVIESRSGTGNPEFCFKARTVTLGGKNYKVTDRLNVVSGEADLYIIEDQERTRYLWKSYRFKMEPKGEVVDLLRSLPDKAVIKLIDTGKDEDDKYYEIQQYAKHGSLLDYIKSNTPIKSEFIRAFISELNDCLGQIHSKNIIHRDIKPGNILIRDLDPPDLVLTDFGISSVSEMSLHQTNLSRTILYSAPESMSGIISKATDYWSLGLITLEMILNRHPFHGADDKIIMFTLATKHVPGINEVEGEFLSLIKGTLTRDPKRRWQYKEVNDWLSGKKDIPVYFEIDSEMNPGNDSLKQAARPYNFCGADYDNVHDLTFAMAANWITAARDFESRKLRDWIVREVRNDRYSTIFEDIQKDEKLSTDQKMFDFFCRVNPDFPLMHKGIVISREWLVDIASRILGAGSVTDAETQALKSLREGWIVKKHIEIFGDNIMERDFNRLMGDLRLAPDDMTLIAKIILVNFSGEYKNKLIDVVRNIFENNVITKPLNKVDTIDETIEKIREILAGEKYCVMDLIEISGAPMENFISRIEINEKSEHLKNACDQIFGEYKRDEIFLSFSKIHGELSEDVTPEAAFDYILETYNLKTEYAKDFHDRLCKCIDYLESFKETLADKITGLQNRINEKLALIENSSTTEVLNIKKIIDSKRVCGLKYFGELDNLFPTPDQIIKKEKLEKIERRERNLKLITAVLIVSAFIVLYLAKIGFSNLLWAALAVMAVEIIIYLYLERQYLPPYVEIPLDRSSAVGNRRKLILDIGGNTKLVLIKIPYGSYMMGSAEGAAAEKPIHKVNISNSFFIGKTQITQGQWKKLMGKNPSGFENGDDFPVERVSWNDCQEFIKKINDMDLVRGKFRLPTEAEWEYACRAGTATRYYWGDAMNNDHCWHAGNAEYCTHPVGLKKPNPWGLYDMCGNVWEWCEDWDGGYPDGVLSDPRGPESGYFRIRRGGGWESDADSCTSSCRSHYAPDGRYDRIGFRIALEL
ncbi:MAG TPA: SUMF1/EgtB/PvdO family nonheme iron enzyme, partial [Candidatus Wallbacteria bacterium]|nr:SUMF1/EgtB/PvdO family nonheme iron enzyme [Candidatus Wallbacteria bacterium]